MLQDDLMDALEYDEIIMSTCVEYAERFGQDDFEKISDKIYNSRTVEKLFINAHKKNLIPNHKDYMATILMIPFLFFRKGQTLVVACFLALALWDKRYNNNNQLSKSELKAMLIQIVYEFKNRYI